MDIFQVFTFLEIYVTLTPGHTRAWFRHPQLSINGGSGVFFLITIDLSIKSAYLNLLWMSLAYEEAQEQGVCRCSPSEFHKDSFPL